jgi:hypothetical protein
MSFLAAGGSTIRMGTSDAQFHVSTWPLLAELPVSYDATDPPLPSEEDEEGNIITSAEFDDFSNGVDDAADAAEAETPQ